MSALLIIAIAAGILLVIALIVLNIRAAKKHREAMQKLAEDNGWTLAEEERRLTTHLDEYTPFNFGTRRRAKWVFQGKQELTFTAFEYECVTESHDKDGRTNRTYHHYQVCILEMPLNGQNLTIGKEGLGKKLWDAFGGEDIDFESDEFSRKFWVKCDNRRFAYDVITPATMEYLLPLRKWSWQWRNNQLIIHKDGRLKAEDVVPTIKVAVGFAKMLPRHLLAK